MRPGPAVTKWKAEPLAPVADLMGGNKCTKTHIATQLRRKLLIIHCQLSVNQHRLHNARAAADPALQVKIFHLAPVDRLHVLATACRVQHYHISPITFADLAGVYAEPVGLVTGKPVYGLLHGHYRIAFLDGLVHQLQHSQWQVVERHIADMGTGVAESDQRARIFNDAFEHLLTMVTHGGIPTNFLAKLHHQIQEQIHHMNVASPGDLFTKKTTSMPSA